MEIMKKDLFIFYWNLLGYSIKITYLCQTLKNTIMKTLNLSTVELAEETLISYKGKNFLIKTALGGQYGFERRVIIFIVKDDCEVVRMKTIGILRLFSDSDILNFSKSEQCLIIGNTHFEPCLDEGKAYIKKYVDFITE